MALREKARAAAHRLGGHVRRHPKKTAGGVLGGGWLIWLGVTLWATYAINQLRFEQRFERAQARALSGDTAPIFDEVVEHERLVHELTARGVVPAPLLRTEAGVVDPLLDEAVKPKTVLQTLHVQKHPSHDRPAFLAQLKQRNAELRRHLDAAGGAPGKALSSASSLAPKEALGTHRIAPASRTRARALAPVPFAAAEARLKALCAARGEDLEEFPGLCERPELSATPVGR